MVDPDVFKDDEPSPERVNFDRSLEMLGGLLLASLVIIVSVGLYFIVTRW